MFAIVRTFLSRNITSGIDFFKITLMQPPVHTLTQSQAKPKPSFL